MKGIIEQAVRGNQFILEFAVLSLQAAVSPVEKNDEQEQEEKPFFPAVEKDDGVVENMLANDFVGFDDPGGFVDENKPGCKAGKGTIAKREK